MIWHVEFEEGWLFIFWNFKKAKNKIVIKNFLCSQFQNKQKSCDYFSFWDKIKKLITSKLLWMSESSMYDILNNFL